MVKDIVVHLDGASDDAVRIAHAEKLAILFGAHLRGVYTHLLPEVTMAMADFSFAASVLTSSQEEALADGNANETALIRRFDLLGVPSAEVRRFDILPDSYRAVFASEARTADLAVVLRPYRPEHIERWPGVVEAGLFDSGRAVYVVPDEPAQPRSEIETVLVAWSDTRESARAVAEAMPFLKRARQVIVALVDRDGPAEADQRVPGADIARYLERHGIRVELRHIPEWNSVADSLLNETTRTGADLVVLGAYGHSKLNEWFFGGVTRDFLTRCQVPMLMAH